MRLIYSPCHSTSQRFRRYHFRAVVGILTPIILTSAFAAIWAVYLRSLDNDSEFVAGPPGGSYVFYAWFIIGVLGLQVSLYGMNAAEAGILMSKTPDRTVPATLEAYDKHGAGTWSGPSGWAKMLRRLRQKGLRGDAAPGLSWTLWFSLALPSLLLFIALPISGLSFETETGYVRQTARNSTGPNVTGFSYANFNERLTSEATDGAFSMWRNAMDARVPGMGVIYTPPDAESMPPSVLPKDDGLSGVFLTAQAENPIEGTAWGLALQYNCSIVEKMSDLTLLTPRDRSNDTESPSIVDLDNDTRVSIANQTAGPRRNLFGVAEYVYKLWPDSAMQDQLLEEDWMWSQKRATGCYYNRLQNVTGDYHDVDQESVFEIILWQHMTTPGFYEPLPNYNESLSHNLTELYGEYSTRLEEDYTYTHTQGPPETNRSSAMSAIGVRCSSAASVGTAQIDGVRSTFTNFVRTDTPINNSTQRCATRLNSNTIAGILRASLFNGNQPEWINDLFSSVSGEPEFFAKVASDLEVDNFMGDQIRLSYLQASDLRSSMLRAYAAYAINLMYSNGQGFTAFDGRGADSGNPNVTAFSSGTVIKPGAIPMEVPMVMFFIWTLITVVLCALYGFRLRWSDTVDEGIRSFRP